MKSYPATGVDRTMKGTDMMAAIMWLWADLTDILQIIFVNGEGSKVRCMSFVSSSVLKSA